MSPDPFDFSDYVGKRVADGQPRPTVPLPCYLDDDAVSTSSIMMFVERAKVWKSVADVTFFFSLASIVIGVGVFIFADRIAINNQQLPVLLSKREALRKSILEIEDRQGILSRENLILPRIYSDWNELTGVVRVATNVVAEGKAETADARFTSFRVSRPSHVKSMQRLGLTKASLVGVATYSEDDLRELKDLCKRKSLDLAEWGNNLEEWFTGFDAYMDEKKNKNVELKKLRQLVERGHNNFEKATAVLKELESQISLSEEKGLFPKDQAAYRKLKLELQDLEEEIAKVRQEFNPNNLYSVIPLIVVRGGAVLLLIFLTQILLAAYRYNTMLSTYYSAIADALRMTQRSDMGLGPNIEQFLKLVSYLYPKDASYTPPESPAQHIVELATKGKG
jgi:ribosomal protein S20